MEQLRTLDAESVHTCVTSPPYFGLRDYGIKGQIGLEPTPQEYLERLVPVFREVRRVLRKDGTLWLVIGDSYKKDILPAESIGCQVLWIKGKGWTADEDAVTHPNIIKSLQEVLELSF